MSADALFQLGIVSVALNTSKTEEHSGRALRRFLAHDRAMRCRGLHPRSPRPGQADSFLPGRRRAAPSCRLAGYRERMPT